MAHNTKDFLTAVAHAQEVFIKTGRWRYQRPVTDVKKCRKCGTCWLYCPTKSRREEDDGTFDSNLDFCKGCGICVAECYAQAIKMIPEEEE
jgi:pyruvate ferredoxin oxidoreductase delta subunit